MDELSEFQSQIDVNTNVDRRLIIELICSSGGNKAENLMSELGIIKIPNIEVHKKNDKKLSKDFKGWTSTSSRAEYIFCEDYDECMRHINSCRRRRVILIVSGSHDNDNARMKQFRRSGKVARIYQRLSPEQLQPLPKHRLFNNPFSSQSRLPIHVVGTLAQKLDNSSQMQLIQILFNEFIVALPKRDEATREFFDFCRKKYSNEEVSLKRIRGYEENYHPEKALELYTDSANLINVLVSTTCSSFNFNDFFKIRLILHDLHAQLKRLHDEQLSEWPKTPLELYRGKCIAEQELDQFLNVGVHVMTRNILSSTTDLPTANFIACEGHGNKDMLSVTFHMRIDHEEVASKPIASVDRQSRMRGEREVILPMGIVFRIESYAKDDAKNSARVDMVRGKAEQNIEKQCNSLPLFIAAAGATTIGVSLVALFLQSMEGSEYYGECAKLMVRAVGSEKAELVNQVRSVINRDYLTDIDQLDINELVTNIGGNIPTGLTDVIPPINPELRDIEPPSWNRFWSNLKNKFS
ncbi:unnamed protein product [Adineta ricciae]|uniref:Uncharacterized protein n=1 Tax=Adineta ricciae TaxID=249248 RepID=A0A815TKQ6_ADIRI|nr:unnamed protein product [Adineta ricciae]